MKSRQKSQISLDFTVATSVVLDANAESPIRRAHKLVTERADDCTCTNALKSSCTHKAKQFPDHLIPEARILIRRALALSVGHGQPVIVVEAHRPLKVLQTAVLWERPFAGFLISALN
ncbi:hypothetical protein CEXT_509681 [Caerostris extrusa]|uniref:SWIM-type domain-containing protein n=1 Tax=Caerostris extrusa TaxID=172846 RepID=A0AAV4U5M2_CAEEX|nr:hypothetical protein CEXT_509681 [Caerostris extrusa]